MKGHEWVIGQQADDADIGVPQEEIDAAVAKILRQYGYNAGTLGGKAAEHWAEADIAREASRLAPHFADKPNPAWQLVHDAIRRRFNRFVVHVDDTQRMPDGDCEAWIKGWHTWVPARIERDGKTWKLPIGRVSGEHIPNMVVAVRPLAA